MKRAELLQRMVGTGVIAVIRSETPAKALKTVEALVAGGITGIELTFSVPHASRVIEQVVDRYEGTNVVVGAGTVLDVTSARLAIMAGAKFIVSPTFSKEVAFLCNLYQVPYVPGVYTPNEAQQALEYGAELVKLFPGKLAGPMVIDEFHGPFPYLNVMPSGGVNVANLVDWFAAGAKVVAVGGDLLEPAKHDDYAAVTAKATEYIAKWREWQQN